MKTVKELLNYLEGVVEVEGDCVGVVNEAALPDKMDKVVYTAVFGQGLVRETARWLIWEIGQAVGVYPASIHQLYVEVGTDDAPSNYTTPAMNIRAMNYNTSRAVFRAANKMDVGAMLFEIARSEIGYTGQRPAEYTTCILAAALKEGYRGPVFIQGDHFQISAARYGSDPAAEVQAVKDLMVEAVDAGFFNIDIDTSTLVDLSFPTLDEQQRLNYSLCAELTGFARSIQPEGITISLGGEIGEVGHKNSTVEELDAFMAGYLKTLIEAEGETVTGISKISVQTGTSHGGVVLPDGTLADVKVDFNTLRDLSKTARDSYGLGGAVQHGASTLPADAFNKFPEVGTVEIHLATGFQNMIFDNLPQEMVDAAYDYLRENYKNEWKPGKTEDQVLYSARKRAIGPFKQQWWDLPAEKQAQMGQVLEDQFAFLFKQLNVYGTRQFAKKKTTRVAIHKPRPHDAAEEAAEEDVSDLAD
ncbi:MAG: class II fructose-bisphosphate aldolase [Ardenticatenaceae bacterium]|nr:class II fructose-bisphosphate aldolase [Ardenticatenaceae bacterium]MCB9443045.1 class II fructose-bisphosphate aldolase [Ardenticatenaceae bacterium]